MSVVNLAIDMRVFLVGYMGVGKTTIGKKLASFLNLEFIDLDKVIENETQLSISNIIINSGEEYFREREREALLNLENKKNILIATGGGAPCYLDNMDLINKLGRSVYLKLDVKSLVNRLQASASKRPLLKDVSAKDLPAFIAAHLKQREPWYEQADFSFNTLNFTAKKLADLASEIQELENKVN